MKVLNRDAKQARAERARLLQIIYRSIDELKPDPTNPRIHSKKQIADSDEAGRVFRFETGHPFRFESGHRSDLKAAGVGHPAGRWW